MSADPRSWFTQVQLLAMDVDGVLTDGTITYDSAGSEQKRFHVADGMGLTLLRLAGISVAWFSGRDCPAVVRRASELKVAHVYQGVRRKDQALARLMGELGIQPARTAFVGDDWNDLPAFEAAGVRIAVANAVSEVRAAANYVTLRQGGQGAVREVCDLLLEAQNLRSDTLRRYLAALKETSSDAASGQ